MFFNRLFKKFLIVLGFLLIGFGIGIIVSKNFQVGETTHWLIIVCSLVLGGFFTALGIAKKIPKKEPARRSFSEGGEIEEIEESEFSKEKVDFNN